MKVDCVAKKTHLMRVIFFAISGALAGCAAQTLNTKLPLFVGRDLQFAIGVLGAPSSVSEYAGTQFVSWSVNQQGSVLLPTTNTSTTAGWVGTTRVYGSTTSSGTMVVPTSAVCTITLHVQGSTVTRWEWQGNDYGCARFATRMNNLAAPASSPAYYSAPAPASNPYRFDDKTVAVGGMYNCLLDAAKERDEDAASFRAWLWGLPADDAKSRESGCKAKSSLEIERTFLDYQFAQESVR